MNNITGSPVEGENFYGREAELKSGWAHIKKGNSLILSAPRRVGKSSFAKKLLTLAESEDWNILEINLEEIHSEREFVTLLVEKLEGQHWWQSHLASVGNTLNGVLESIKTTVSVNGIDTALEWKSKRVDVYQKIKKLLDHQKPTLIMVDELTVLLNGFLMRDEVEGHLNIDYFMNWLRSLRQVSKTKIRWVFCSSVGIENFTFRHQLTYTINDLTPFGLKAFDSPTSRKFLNKLAEGNDIVLPDEVIERMIQKLDYCLPYFLQLLFFHFHQLVEIHEHHNSIQTVDVAFTDLVGTNQLNTWHERLNEYKELKDDALVVLKSLSVTKTGINRDVLLEKVNIRASDPDNAEDILNKVLLMLKNDGYVLSTGKGKYVFRSPLLREFWFNHFVK